MSLSIRTRLTLWYVLVLTVVLAANAAGFYFVHSRSRLARLDEELVRAESLVARLVREELDEGAALEEAAREALEDLVMPGLLLAVFDSGGARLAGNWAGPSVSDAATLAESGTSATVEGSGETFRAYRARERYRDMAYWIGAAEPLRAMDRELAGLRRALLGSLLVALTLAAAGGFWIARAALQPVQHMAAQARLVTERTPGLRLTTANPRDELGQLAKAFNDLLGRLERALAQQRQFMADASHELRTPVSIGRTAIEVTLGRDGRPEGEYRDALRVLAEQMGRLSRLVEDMFTLARADAAELPIRREVLYLDELLARCVKEAAVLAEAKGIALERSGPCDVEVEGDEGRLRELVMNLLDNAVRHSPAGGRVRVDLAVEHGSVEVAVADRGSGIPEAEKDRVFERFVRLDAARRSGDGAGLGLAIARAIAQAHGGTLELKESSASGSTFLLRLPPAGARPEPQLPVYGSRT